MDVSTLPFNKHLGLSISPSGDKPTVILEPCAHHLNHVDTVHATVIYGVAEAASGHCLLARFPSLVDSFVAVLRNSSAKYRRPASPDGDIHAWGTLSEQSAVKFYERLTSRGRASVDVEVSVTQNDTELFTGTFGWFVAAKES
ncbi:MAG: PaaI family thioesterase [Planctomycetota bacterium]|jgi:acyl-coenzyme A thioesterase PaaI-like protein